MKRPYRDIKKIIWMKWRLLTFTKGVARGLGRFRNLKKHQSHPNQMNLKKYQSPLMIQVRKNKSLKKHQAQAMEKKVATKAGKKVKKASQSKKAPKSPEFIDSSEEEEEEGLPKDNKEKKKHFLCLGWKKKSEVFLILKSRVKI